MIIDKKGLSNMMILHLIIGIIVIAIRMLKPEYVGFDGLIDAFVKKDILTVFLTSLIPIFVLLSYVLFIIGIAFIGQVTIRRMVDWFKSTFLNSIPMSFDYCCEVNYFEFAIIACYIFVAIPLFLYLILPILTSIAVIILVLSVIISAFS